MFTKKRLNKAQIHILEMFNYCNDDQSLQDLQKVLSDYYSQRVQQEADKLWDEGVLDDKSIETILQEHLRTPYRTNEREELS